MSSKYLLSRTFDPIFALSIGASAAWLRIRREELERFYDCKSEHHNHNHNQHRNRNHSAAPEGETPTEDDNNTSLLGRVVRPAEHRKPQNTGSSSNRHEEDPTADPQPPDQAQMHTHTHTSHPPTPKNTFDTLLTRLSHLVKSDYGKWDWRDRNQWDRYKEEKEREERKRRKRENGIEERDDVGRLEEFKRRWRVDEE